MGRRERGYWFSIEYSMNRFTANQVFPSRCFPRSLNLSAMLMSENPINPPDPAENLIEKTEQSDATIRTGSPFSPGSEQPLNHAAASSSPLSAQQVHDVGVMKYTAMGAVAASILVAGFAAIAMFWFPVGGILIAALGCFLSLFGLMSHFQRTAALMLVVHLCFFVFGYKHGLSL